MRQRTGKAARLSGVDFDKQAVNDIPETTDKAEIEQKNETISSSPKD
jgi:hypothetical protein